MITTPSLRAHLAVLAAACASAAPAVAQDKTDGLWRATGGAALSATSGNSSTSSVMLSADAVKATNADKVTLGAMTNYAKNKTGGVNQTTANKWGAFGQYDYNLSPRTFVFGRLGLDGDELTGLERRTSLAAGVGYKLIATKETTFELFGGLGYSTDKYDSAKTIGSKTGTSFSRTSLYLAEASSHQLSPTVSFKQRLELYPGLTGDKAKLAKFTAGLGVALSSTLNLTVGLTDTYNSKPPAGTKKNDAGVFTGVNVKFGG
jgi:putative salt-induced outer membrane protein